MDLLPEIIKADKRIRPHCLRTPLLASRPLAQLNGGQVYLKMESEQHTGSFKARGSMNRIATLSAEEKARGVITASTGNHALGFARALEITGTTGTIYLPENASPSKIEALRHYRVDLQFHGRDSLQTELFAKQKAASIGAIWVSPYNDPAIIAGQGTIGLELLQKLDQIDFILATVGGGGLISGIAGAIKPISPATKVIGCQPEHSPEMSLSIKEGKIVQLPEYIPTLSDGSAGGLEPGSITFPICRELVDDFILVSEEEIKRGIRFMINVHHKIVEGAAGVAVASYLRDPEAFKGATVVIIICGANIDTEKLREIL